MEVFDLTWNGITTLHYQRILNTVSFFTSKGYVEIALPWAVDKEFIDETIPDKTKNLPYYAGKHLVGSAEQAFLSMFSGKQTEDKTHYISLGPCFRHEPVLECFTRPYFFKAELFSLNATQPNLEKMIDLAHENFSKRLKCDVFPMEDGSYDIIARYSGLELGSYGLRSNKKTNWIYGTAMAEPRFSDALHKL
jgi:hypothetical protein